MFVWTCFYLQVSFKFSLSCSQVTEKMSFTSVHELVKNGFYFRYCSLSERIISKIFDKVESRKEIRFVERFSQLLKKILELKFSHSCKLRIFCCSSPFSPNKSPNSSLMCFWNNPFCSLLLNEWLKDAS